jgi:catechol 2,3-dioxygenase
MSTNKLPGNIELGEVKLKVSNLARSLVYYQEGLGFTVKRREGDIAELGAPDGPTLLVLEEIPDAVVVPPNRTTGLYHYAVLLPTRRDLGVTLRRLVELGIDIGQADHGVSEALYLSDPDHNGIEIYRDRPRSEWKYEVNGNIHMVTEPIDWRGLLREAEGHKWNGIPSGTKIGHVHLHVHDLDAAHKFYCDQLGFDLMVDGGRLMGALFVAAGGYHHHLGLNVWAGRRAPRPPVNGTGLAYYTIGFPDDPSLRATLEQLRSQDISLEDRNGAWFVQDPSGNWIRLTITQ